MALRRGFKSEAERIAQRVRTALGKGSDESVFPEELAQLLGVEVRAGDELIPRKRFQDLGRLQPNAFSACTFRPSPDRTVVVFNPLSSPVRQTSDLAHELAHIVLGHELSRVERLGDVTFLTCDPVQEEEAAWLGGCLLLPRALLLAETRKEASVDVIAEKCRVSEEMARYRLNVTGVLRQHKARSMKTGSSS